MADIHTLPAPALPEGWAVSTVFADEWVRPVFRHRPCYEGEDPVVAVLQVCRWVNGEYGAQHREGEGWPTLREAIAAAELAYCGCRVGESFPRESK